jgi:uncharacterized membrane protein YfcA
MAPDFMKPTALLLNLFVSSTAFIFFYRGGHFKWKLFWPFAVASIPMAFVGGMITLDGTIYKKILGILLLIPVLRLIIFSNKEEATIKESNLLGSICIGAFIGFLSGLIGIGGGILLSPMLLLLNWSNQKQTAAISSLFILVNSLSGLAGQLSTGLNIQPNMLSYVFIAFSGGCLGAWFGSMKFNQVILKNVLAIILLIAAIKLLTI